MSGSVACRICGARVKPENEPAHMRKVHPNVAFEPRGDMRTRPAASRFYWTSRAKKAAFALLAAAVLLVAGTMLLQSSQKSVPIDPNATPVHVSMSGFDPSTITVKVGARLTIDLINMDNQYHTDGGGWHNFAMDAFGMNETVAPLGQNVFTVPTSAAGTYGWYCSVCCGGRASPAMNGRIVVEP